MKILLLTIAIIIFFGFNAKSLDTLYLTKEYLALPNDSNKITKLFKEAEKHFFSNPYYSLALLEYNMPMVENCEYPWLKVENYKAYSYALLQTENPDKAMIYLKKAYSIYQEHNDTINLAFVNNMIALAFETDEYTDSALFYYYDAIDILNNYQDADKQALKTRTQSVIYTNLGNLFTFKLANYQEALLYYKKAYAIAELQQDSFHLAASLSNIGVVFFEKQQFDIALTYYTKANYIARKINNIFIEGKTYHNIGNCLFEYKKYNEAIESYNKAISAFQKVGNLNLVFKIKIEICNSYIAMPNLKQAGVLLEELKNDTANIEQQIKLSFYKLLYEYYEESGNSDLALFYWKAYYNFEKLIREKQDKKYIDKLIIKHHTKEAQLNNLILTEQLDNQRKKHLLTISIITIALLILLGILISYRLRRKILIHKLESKNRELTANSLHLMRQSEFIKSIMEDVRKISTNANSEGRIAIRQLVSKIAIHTNTEMWAGFEKSFSEVYTSFFKNIYKKHPDLTAKDKKLCAFLKLNMSTKDIAIISNMTIRGVESARHRLRKKFKISQEADLNAYLDMF